MRVVLRILLIVTIILCGYFCILEPTYAANDTPERVLADFERGLDARGFLSNSFSLPTAGPRYAWESPPSPAGDDINYWDVKSDGDGKNEYVDYVFDFEPQDWRPYTALNIKYSTWTDGGGSGTKIRVYAHDADGTGNSDNNGYHYLGDFASDGTINPSLTGMPNRDQADRILIRVYESFFSGVNVEGARQRTHLNSLSLTRPSEFPGSSFLLETSCLENDDIKLCFDDQLGGTISSVYNKRSAPSQNSILPTLGGAFQIALRSTDPISPCPNKKINWGALWNPTQAGCEQCYQQNGKWYNAASDTWDKVASATHYHIQFRPRNYFHHNNNDCTLPLPYTTTGPQQENVYVTMDANLVDDYAKVTWKIKNESDETYFIDPHPKRGIRHELPTVYTADFPTCYRLAYQDKNTGNLQHDIQDRSFPCQSGTTEWIDALVNRWYSIYNPNNPNQELTIVANTSMMDNTLAKGSDRNYSGNGVQLDCPGYFAITPGMEFETTAYILPYRYDDQMADGNSVLDFIEAVQKADVTGYARHYNQCQEITGWASNSNFSLEVNSVKVFDNNRLIGDVPANLKWDNTVGDHKFSLRYRFPLGNHSVRVLAQDPETLNHIELNDSPIAFSCP